MSDIIRLLPDSVASQIAAGEVIQRPASALKELLENSIDAGAKRIQVILKDAGKSLIQVVDDGCGMTENDARLCFERHATSKISKATDLFKIRTMGFRGEALASMAAIAHVALKTRRHGDETGVLIEIEGSELKDQQTVSCPAGSSVSVKNLFYNIPARRNFLKSNAAETRHLIEELQRVAIAHPGIAFSMHHDGNEVFRLPSENLRQRITGLFGANYNERLVPLNEESMALKITGFFVKPQFAKKTRGEQYFFVNTRYVRDPYLNHAVCGGMDELLQAGSYPSYFINLHADPSNIDVNIHPSKTEVKFDDERLVYSVMKATVKRALGKFSITPSLDFEQERAFEVPLEQMNKIPTAPSIKVDKKYNPHLAFEGAQGSGREATGWESLYAGITKPGSARPKIEVPSKLNFETDEADQICGLPEQCFKSFGPHYIVIQRPGELMIGNRVEISERVYYEQLVSNSSGKKASQQNLFPQAIEFSASDFVLVKSIEKDIQQLGFDIREFGKNTFVVHGIPVGLEGSNTKRVLEEVLEEFKHHASSFRSNSTHAIAMVVSRSRSTKGNDPMTASEIKALVGELFNCEKPLYTVAGKQAFIRISVADINRQFSELNNQK